MLNSAITLAILCVMVMRLDLALGLMSLAVTRATQSQQVLAEASMALASRGSWMGGAEPSLSTLEMETRSWGLEAAHPGHASPALCPTACVTSLSGCGEPRRGTERGARVSLSLPRCRGGTGGGRDIPAASSAVPLPQCQGSCPPPLASLGCQVSRYCIKKMFQRMEWRKNTETLGSNSGPFAV